MKIYYLSRNIFLGLVDPSRNRLASTAYFAKPSFSVSVRRIPSDNQPNSPPFNSCLSTKQNRFQLIQIFGGRGAIGQASAPTVHHDNGSEKLRDLTTVLVNKKIKSGYRSWAGASGLSVGPWLLVGLHRDRGLWGLAWHTALLMGGPVSLLAECSTVPRHLSKYRFFFNFSNNYHSEF